MTILVTGGAGYIGSHVVKQLLETTNHEILVIDNFSTGHIEAINTLKTIRGFNFIQMDLKEFDKVKAFFSAHKIDTIMHFAASSIVSESMKNPMKYYMNNSVNTTHLIQCASEYGVEKFIFSSTAAVYGEADTNGNSISENSSLNPINPYGKSKLFSETVLQECTKVNSDLKYVIFRYFNVAGADVFYKNDALSPRIGEWHEPETHLIPLVVQTALELRENITIFGDAFPTKDGTCIRDYIHVDDLAQAHIQAIEYLDKHESNIFNVGYGQGYSVKEIIETVKCVSQNEFEVKIGEKREGDPAFLVANSQKIKTEMQWIPKYDNIELICESAYEWEKSIKKVI